MPGTDAIPPCARVHALRSDLRACMIDGLLYCVMVGIAELYIPAFVEALGLGPVPVGLIATVPLLIGAAVQLRAPALLRRMGSYSRFVAICAYVQALMYLPLALVALSAHRTLPLLREHHAQWVMTGLVFVLVSIYWTAALACGPAWITLAGAIIPARIRTNYFARRLRWLQGAQLLAILLHGVIMTRLAGNPGQRSDGIALGDGAGGMNPAVAGFAVIFTLGFLARAGSGYYLSRYSAPRHPPEHEHEVGLGAFLSRLTHSRDGRYVLYIGLMNAASLLANPFFNPYMLDMLGLRHRALSEVLSGAGSAYAFFLAAGFLGRVLALPFIGRGVQRHGAFRVLVTGSLMIIPVPVLWLLTDDVWALLGFQVATGVAQATFEYAAFMMYYEAVAPRERTSIVTQFQFLNESCKSAGSLVGAQLLRGFGKDTHAYAIVFWTSAIARLAVLPLVARVAGARHRPEEITTQLIGEPRPAEPMMTEVRRISTPDE